MMVGARVKHWFSGSRRRRVRRRAVQELRRSLLLIVDLDALVASLANRLGEVFDPEHLVIFERHPGEPHFRAVFHSGFEDGLPEPLSLAVDGNLVRWFEVNRSCLRASDQRGVLRHLEEPERRTLEALGCQLCAPMMAKNQVIGCLLVGGRGPRSPYRAADATLLYQLAEQASLAFQNAALYREQRERLDRLHRSDRLAAMGQLAAGVAHEVRNPLTAIRSTMQYVGRFLPSERRELVEELIDEVDRIDNIIAGLLSLGRSEELLREPCDLAQVVEQTIRLLGIRARRQGVRIVGQVADRVPIVGDPNQLKQVILNLVLNALQAMPEGGTIGLRCTPAPVAEGDRWVRLVIEDDGPGIPEALLGKVFDPFFTTKAEGTGMGLSICQSVVEQHGGRLQLRSEVGVGTEITLLLPAAPEKPMPLPMTVEEP